MVEKLRVANKALRDQLKEFARALDTSLKQNNAQTAAINALKGESGKPEESSDNKSSKARAKVLKTMKSKISVMKKVIDELKLQLMNARKQDRVLTLQNQAKEHERKVQGLMDENRSLLGKLFFLF